MRNFSRLQPFWLSAKIANFTISQMPWMTASLIGMTTVAALVQLAPAQAAVLSNWEFDPTSQELEIVVPGGTTPRYFLAAEPARIVIDLPNTEIGTVAEQQTYGGAVREIRIAQFEPGVTRIVLELAPGTILAPQQVELRRVGSEATEGQPGDRWVLRPLLATNAPVPMASATPAEPAVSAPAPEATNTPAPDVLPPLEPGALEIPVELSSPEPASAPDASATAAPPPELPPADTATAPDQFPAPTVTLPDTELPDTEATETEAEVPEVEEAEVEPEETEADLEVAEAEPEETEADLEEADLEEADLEIAEAELPAEQEVEVAAEEPDLQPETEAAQELEPEQAEAAETTPSLAVEEPEPEPIAQVPSPAEVPVSAEEEAAIPEVELEPAAEAAIAPPPASTPTTSEAGATSGRSAMVTVPPLAAPEQPAPEQPASSSPTASDSPPARLQASSPAQLSPELPAALPSERTPESATPTPAPSSNLVEFGQPLPESAFSSLPSVSPGVVLPPAIATAPGFASVATDTADRILLPSGTVLNLRYPGETAIELAAGQSRQEVLVLAEAVRDQAGNVVLPEGTYVIGRFETQEESSQFVAQAVSVQGQNLLVNAQSDNLLETRQGGLLRNSALGVAAGLVLGGLTGVGLIPAIAAGAATGAGSAYLTNPDVATIQPNQVVEVRLVDDLMARSTFVP